MILNRIGEGSINLTGGSWDNISDTAKVCLFSNDLIGVCFKKISRISPVQNDS